MRITIARLSEATEDGNTPPDCRRLLAVYKSKPKELQELSVLSRRRLSDSGKAENYRFEN